MKQEVELLKQKLKERGIIFGSHVGFREGAFSEILGDVGYDLVWIDTEHSPLGKGDILNHLIGARAAGIVSLVRVPWNEPIFVKNVLDMGADGLVFPMIRSVEEAQEAIRACYYPPAGIRGVGTRRANRYNLDDRSYYLDNAHDTFLKIMQIEHVDNLDSLEGILAVEGVDGIVVGPSDFAASMGKIKTPRDPELLAAFDTLGRIAKASGKIFGISMGFNEQNVKEWIARGVNWLNIGFEYQYVVSAASSTLNTLRSLAGK
ncbi:MAG: HpcH/HpaI aldolase family protein [Sphaerochaetaceae bacterium]|jgi:2-keto-3-deoxy-L-rhamnonate aldolase RhmA